MLGLDYFTTPTDTLRLGRRLIVVFAPERTLPLMLMRLLKGNRDWRRQ